jgi:hypothetical protein
MKIMRNVMIGALLALSIAIPVGATQSETEKLPLAISDIGINIGNEGIVSAYVSAIFDSETKGFLHEISLPKNMLYLTPGKGPNEKFGELLVRKNGVVAAAGVIQCQVNPNIPAEDIKNILQDATFSEPIRQNLYQFNLNLLGIQNVINAAIPGFIEKRNKELKKGDIHLPYNFVSTDIFEVEQFHKMQERPRIFSSALRGVVTVDNFAIPLYLRFYLIDHKGQSRLLILLTMDSNYDIMKEAGNKIAKLATK